MRARTTPRLVIFGDFHKSSVPQAVAEFRRFVRTKAQILACSDIKDHPPKALREADYAVVFGGDGTLICAARVLSSLRIPVIGVNLGKLGYLAEFSVAELEGLFDQIMAGKISTERRMMLECRTSSGRADRRSGGRAVSRPCRLLASAVNEVFITAGPPFRVIELEIEVDGHHVAQCISDGLIVSTPTGSTAYNLSAGGPILPGSMKAMVVTPICPHSLSFRPIVIDASRVVGIRGIRVNEGTSVAVDGAVQCRLEPDGVVRIKRARRDFLIVNNPTRSPWDTLATRLHWAKMPKYVQPR